MGHGSGRGRGRGRGRGGHGHAHGHGHGELTNEADFFFKFLFFNSPLTVSISHESQYFYDLPLGP